MQLVIGGDETIPFQLPSSFCFSIIELMDRVIVAIIHTSR